MQHVTRLSRIESDQNIGFSDRLGPILTLFGLAPNHVTHGAEKPIGIGFPQMRT